MRVLVKVVDPGGIETAGAPFNAVNDIALEFARAVAKSGEKAGLGAFLGEFLVDLGEEHFVRADPSVNVRELLA